MGDDQLRRRTLLSGVGMAATAGVLGMGRVTAAPTTGPRTGETSGGVFLGGEFFELGVGPDGGFGASPVPETFFGNARGVIGMYADFDGFDAGTNTDEYDYFLPGTPEERFSVGYIDAEGTQQTASNGNDPGEEMPTTDPTVNKAGTELTAQVASTFDGTLDIDQTYSFDSGNKYFRTDVTLTNTGETALESVRYQRSFDPDNGVDAGCSYRTKNTVLSQPPTSDEALVSAEIYDGDSCELASRSSIPIFYYSTDSRARVATGASSSSLVPSPVVYAPEDYDEPQSEGTVLSDDTYLAITFDVGTLAPGDSASMTFYTALTGDLTETKDDIDDDTDAEAAPSDDQAKFSLACDEEGCREDAVDGNERVTLSNDAPDVGEDIELSVTVTNVGDDDGFYFGELTDGFDSYGAKRVHLDEGEKTTLTYTLSFDEPGTYQMFLTDDHIADITVGDIPGS